MIPELGHFAAILALLVACAQAILPLIGARNNSVVWMAFASAAARLQLYLLAIAFACLTHAFVVGDFSVAYVAQHSNRQLPLLYRIAGVWGGHEGSLLLWSLMLAVWGAAVARFSRALPAAFTARVLAVMAAIAVGFLLFMLLTSNPFERLFPPPPDGRDLNPLLQDFGLAVHPPMLYAGYVGFSVAFAFAIAALLGGRLDAAWARWTRPWTTVAWLLLTVGITLGSWWAYYELGWGGWWFWDPVENASFMPWLAGTALIHSLAATEKRGVFKAWTVLLAICAFSLSLLGAFLVRSGVLTSVHAFATDPARGVFILIFLTLVVGGSLALYAYRAPTLVARAQFTPLSREAFLLINNVFFAVLCFTVLLGTMYPLMLDALTGAKISVGAPYFDLLFALFGAPLLLLLGIGAHLRWRRDRASRIGGALWMPALASIIIGALAPLTMAHYSPTAAIGATLGAWCMLATLSAVARGGVRAMTRAQVGMLLAHVGVGVFVVGVTFTNAYSVEKDVRMQPGDSLTLAGRAFVFEGVTDRPGARHATNYDALRGHFRIREGAHQFTLLPEKRVYLVQKNPMTEAAIDPGFTRDVFIALGEPLGNDAWSVRIYYKPLIRWIWLGALLMALGGLIAAADRRYRRTSTASPAAASTATLTVSSSTMPTVTVSFTTMTVTCNVNRVVDDNVAGDGVGGDNVTCNVNRVGNDNANSDHVVDGNVSGIDNANGDGVGGGNVTYNVNRVGNDNTNSDHVVDGNVSGIDNANGDGVGGDNVTCNVNRVSNNNTNSDHVVDGNVGGIDNANGDGVDNGNVTCNVNRVGNDNTNSDHVVDGNVSGIDNANGDGVGGDNVTYNVNRVGNDNANSDHVVDNAADITAPTAINPSIAIQ